MKASTLVILLAIATVSNCETCPPQELVSPCECEENDDGILVTCAGDTLKVEEVQNAMRNLVGKQNVEIQLDDLRLGTLPSDFFNGIGVRILDFAHCDLQGLSEDHSKRPLQGLESSLEELIIVASFTEENGPVKLKLDHLKRLRELDLSYNSITELSNDCFGQGLPALESIFISNNGIQEMGDRAFANLPGLQRLSLDGNRFGDLKRSMLPRSADNLEILELDNNALTRIPEDLFSNMPKLDDVSLRTNGIVRLDEKTWSRIYPQLWILRLEGNPIECDSHLSWLFNSQSSTAIFGECGGPRDKNGLTLQELIDKH